MQTRGSKCECVQAQEHMRYMACWVLTAVNFSVSNSYEYEPGQMCVRHYKL